MRNKLSFFKKNGWLINEHFSNDKKKCKGIIFTAYRSTSYMMEAIGALLCVVIGGIMTIMFGLSIRQQQTGPRIYSRGVAITGLVFNIIGGKNSIGSTSFL